MPLSYPLLLQKGGDVGQRSPAGWSIMVGHVAWAIIRCMIILAARLVCHHFDPTDLILCWPGTEKASFQNGCGSKGGGRGGGEEGEGDEL